MIIESIVTSMAALGSGAITVDTSYPEQPAAETDGLLVRGFRVRAGHRGVFRNDRSVRRVVDDGPNLDRNTRQAK